MVRDKFVYLIDPFFVQVRPSAWRQAVDLANMMLVLAVRTDAERVYRRALQSFTPDDIAGAVAAARGIASPSQLRAAMKRDGRNLVKQFRALAPPRHPISLQRWNVKRILLTLALVFGVFVTLEVAFIPLLSPSYSAQLSTSPRCTANNETILMAQAVPSATLVPCVASLPSGWSLGRVTVRRGFVS